MAKKVVKKNKLIKQLKEKENNIKVPVLSFEELLLEQSRLDFNNLNILNDFTRKVKAHFEDIMGADQISKKDMTFLPEIKPVPFEEGDKEPKFLFKIVRNNQTVIEAPESEIIALLHKHDHFRDNNMLTLEQMRDIPVFFIIELSSMIEKFKG